MIYKRLINGYKFAYNSETGKVYRWFRYNRYWKEVGKRLDNECYLVLGFQGKQYMLSRFIWLIVYDKWPDNEIDHKDRNNQNNRLSNLRDVTHQENVLNSRSPIYEEYNENIQRSGRVWIIKSPDSIYLGRATSFKEALQILESYTCIENPEEAMKLLEPSP